MKKHSSRIIMVFSTIITLVVCIVTTFAWYTAINKGIIEVPVDTVVDEGIVLAFTPFSELEGVLLPAQMKTGVINNTLTENKDGSYQSGTIEVLGIPTGEALLPKLNAVKGPTDEVLYYKYSINENDFGNLLPNSDYLTYPATSIYRQFNLTVGSTTATQLNATFSIGIQYTDSTGKFLDLYQQDAIGINFYLCNTELTSAELSSISVDRYKSATHKEKSFVTISELMYKHQTAKLFTMNKKGNQYFVDKDPDFTLDKLNDGDNTYKITPGITEYKDKKFTYDFKINGLQVNQDYFLIINVFYNLPDELLLGDLLLTDEIVLNINYSIENVVS